MIKKFISILISGVLFFSLLTPAAFAASNPYYYHDCTWFAWQYAYDTLGIALPSWGYAEDWVYGAQRDGYSTGTTPAVHAVMVWDGHVGIVTQISADGQSVYICQGGQDDDYHPDWYGEGWYAANGPCSSGKAFLGYVYLAGMPSNTSDSGSSESSESSESTESTETTSGSEETPAASQQQEQSTEQAAVVPESSELSAVVQSKTDAQREEELAELRERKNALTAEIEETGKEIDALEVKLNAAKSDNEARLRTMYMFGTDSYLEILFSSENAADFFSKAVQIGNIIAMDMETVQNMENLSRQIKLKKSSLEDALNELNEIYI